MRFPSGMSRRAVAVAAAAVAVVAGATVVRVASTGEDAPQRAAPGPTPVVEAPAPPEPEPAPEPEVVGAYFGVHTKVEGKNAETREATIELESQLGRTVDINHHFYPWDEAFPTDLERWDVDHGRIPMISWNGRGPFTSDIAAGRHDRLIRDRARRVAHFGDDVLIRWFWEMDGNKKAKWAEAPEDYVAAWRHIHGIFAAQGATNVKWVWCPNASAFADGEAQQFYPGPEYVDWTCGDGYNWAPGRRGDQWETFDDIFGAFYLWAAQQGKPIMVGEYGVQERGDGDKAAWIRDTQTSVRTRFPLIRALVYFNANQDYDWRMDTTDASAEAFRAMANDPWFTSDLKQTLATG